MKKVQNIEPNKALLFERVFGAKPAYEISAAASKRPQQNYEKCR